MMVNNFGTSDISSLLKQSLRQCSLQSIDEARCVVSAYAKEVPVQTFSFGFWGKYTWRDAQKTLVSTASFLRDELASYVDAESARAYCSIAEVFESMADSIDQYPDGHLPDTWGDYLLEVCNMMVNISRNIKKHQNVPPVMEHFVDYTEKLIKLIRWAHLLDSNNDAPASEPSVAEEEKKTQDSEPHQADDKEPQRDIQSRIAAIEDQLGEQNPHFRVTPYDNKTDYWQELDKLVGMDNIKRQLHDLISDFHLQMDRKAKHPDLKVSPVFHCLYLGNPGTGKTTVARLVSGILRQEGLIKGGQYLEVGNQNLISPYVGVPAKIAELACLYCLDGLLFIDEAYAIANNKGRKSDPGAQIIDTLTQLIENYRDRLCIVLAGYENEMKDFLRQTNQGFVSRFNHVVYFNDFNAEDMTQIFLQNIAERYYRIETKCISVVLDIFDVMAEKKNNYPGFANARTVRLFTDVVVTRASQRMQRERAEGRQVDLDLLVLEDFKLSDEDMQRVLGLM